MNFKTLKIAILLDVKNNWIYKHLKESRLLKLKCKTIKIFYDLKKIKGFDVVFPIGFTKILSKKFLNENKFVIIIHESNLPKGKGFAPVQWQIINKKNKIPVTMIKADLKIDSGDIIARKNIILKGNELYDEIRSKQFKVTEKLIFDFIKKYPKIKFKPQKGKETFFKKRFESNSELDINKTIKSQFNLLRISNNKEWPAFFKIRNNTYILKIYKSTNDQNV